MKKYSIGIIILLLSVVIFGATFFGVLRVEEIKRKEQQAKAREEASLYRQDTDATRKAYFDSVRLKKEELRKQMSVSEQQYQDLLKDQPNLVSDKKQTVTKTVTQTVPVTTTQTVTKPKSTKTTKSS